MSTGRMEAFSDGVIAILITVMVLELPIPHGTTWEALRHALPVLLSYVLSFVYLGIYWNNHHHMLHATDRVSGLILWANLHLLFWLSLIPFTTAWLGENSFAPTPAAAYGLVLLAAAIAYNALQTVIIRDQGDGSLVAAAVGRDAKGRLSPLLYITGIALSFVNQWPAMAVYTIAALIWLVPDRRIERTVTGRTGAPRADDGSGDLA
jgi:TMEM175 potassium channel family protein